MRRQKLYLTLVLVAFLSIGCVEEPTEEDCTKTNEPTTDTVVASDDSLEGEDKCDTDDGDGDGSGDGSGSGSGDGYGSDNSDEVTDLESLNAPWKREDTSIVIDAYEQNDINWNEMAADTKMVGVIHRSSIGLRVDNKYVERKKIAKERGYLWGAYHLGYRGNTIAQADLFLSLVDGEEDTLMILDLEDTSSSRFMSLDEAKVFMDYVYEKTGRIPIVYANHSTTKKMNTKFKNDPIFQQSRLWYARFKSRVTDFPAGIWKNYFLWQFSSEINCSRTGACLYNVPGTTKNMDVNVYNRDPASLMLEWNND
jgi:lysozyme